MKRILFIIVFLLLCGWILPIAQKIILALFTWCIITIWNMPILLLLVIVGAFIAIRSIVRKD